MNLWIRSQDKTILEKVDKIALEIEETTDEKIYHIDSAYTDLGTYKTKERTLEILDEIQKQLVIPTEIKLHKDGLDFTPIKDYIQVYQMPED